MTAAAEVNYPLDMISPIRHVVTRLEETPGMTVAALAATYHHPIPTDLIRVREAERVEDAETFLMERALQRLGKQVVADGDGYRLAVPFEKLRYDGRPIHRTFVRDESDVLRSIRASYASLVEQRKFHVVIRGGRGAEKEVELRLHPLAQAIPAMPRGEFEEMAADVRKQGVINPIWLYQGQVLDGRHRVALADALKVPIMTPLEFEGTDDEARAHVISQNVHRRMLTTAQRGQIVLELFLPQAEAAARARQRDSGGDQRSPDRSPPTGGNRSAGVEAIEQAVQDSGGLATVRTVQRMAPVRDAPETKERVRRGEIKTATAARKAAQEELGLAQTEPEVAQPRTAYDRLGCARGDVRHARIAVVEDRVGGPGGKVNINKVQERITEIRDDLNALVTAIEARRNR